MQKERQGPEKHIHVFEKTQEDDVGCNAGKSPTVSHFFGQFGVTRLACYSPIEQN
jgi:hypothetical protein